MSGYVSAGVALLSVGTSIDQAKQAKHQGKLAMEEQTRQFEADQIANQKAIDLQKQMNDANLAQASAAAAESKSLMDRQLKAADEATNRANSKRPDTNRMLSAASQTSRSGSSGTMLTGSQGVSTSGLTLGGSTLLGQ